MQVFPAASVNGEISLPGDKSVSHRAAILLSMSTGTGRIENFSASADCRATVECLCELGVRIEADGARRTVTGVGKIGFRPPGTELDCQNSGTSMRLLAGLLAGQPFNSVLTGDESLKKRPMRRIIAPLGLMGCRIDSDDGKAPLRITGRNPLKGAEILPEVASAQIKSAVLLAGVNADGTTTVVEPVPTRDHTERMLRWLGVDVFTEPFDDGLRISVKGDEQPVARDIVVPSDISAATFFMVAAACLDGSDITMKNVGVNGTRRAIIDVLNELGADIRVTGRRESCNEPVADINVRGGLRVSSGPNVVEGAVIANLIDEIPALAVFGTQLEGGLEIRDAGELRIKESDRIAAIVENLRKMGADVDEFPDGFAVGRSRLKGVRLSSEGDHRIAMAFAVAALFADGPTEVAGAECCGVSFPGFFDVLSAATAKVPFRERMI